MHEMTVVLSASSMNEENCVARSIASERPPAGQLRFAAMHQTSRYRLPRVFLSATIAFIL